jgi:hypothetical protein
LKAPRSIGALVECPAERSAVEMESQQEVSSGSSSGDEGEEDERELDEEVLQADRAAMEDQCGVGFSRGTQTCCMRLVRRLRREGKPKSMQVFVQIHHKAIGAGSRCFGEEVTCETL